MSGWNEAADRNQAAWNEIADVRSTHIDRGGFDAEFFARGGVNLPDPVVEALPQVDGLSLLHL